MSDLYWVITTVYIKNRLNTAVLLQVNEIAQSSKLSINFTLSLKGVEVASLNIRYFWQHSGSVEITVASQQGCQFNPQVEWGLFWNGIYMCMGFCQAPFPHSKKKPCMLAALWPPL